MSNVYNTFIHSKLGDGHATLAIRETIHDEDLPTLEVGVAFCSPSEQFSRRIGRTIAAGRLNAKRRFYCVVERNPDLKLKTQAEAMLNQLLDGDNVVYDHHQKFGWQVVPNTELGTAATPRADVPRWVEEAAARHEEIVVETARQAATNEGMAV